ARRAVVALAPGARLGAAAPAAHLHSWLDRLRAGLQPSATGRTVDGESHHGRALRGPPAPVAPHLRDPLGPDARPRGWRNGRGLRLGARALADASALPARGAAGPLLGGRRLVGEGVSASLAGLAWL